MGEAELILKQPQILHLLEMMVQFLFSCSLDFIAYLKGLEMGQTNFGRASAIRTEFPVNTNSSSESRNEFYVSTPGIELTLSSHLPDSRSDS